MFYEDFFFGLTKMGIIKPTSLKFSPHVNLAINLGKLYNLIVMGFPALVNKMS